MLGVGRRRLLAALVSIGACGREPLPATGTESVESFASDIVGETYVLRIRVPPGYDPAGGEVHPIVFQLDPTFVGLQQYAITVGLISDRAERGDWPEAIVVGIDYEGEPKRDRDYLPPDPPDPELDGDGADTFYAMLTDELIPDLQGRHAIDPTRRYLLGHSNGGIFAWYAAFRHDPAAAEPVLAGIVAADNGYTEALFTYERWHDERADDLPLRIYATRAEYNGAIQKVGFEAMIDRLEGRGYPSLALESTALETDHAGAVWPSYEQGLDFLLGAP